MAFVPRGLMTAGAGLLSARASFGLRRGVDPTGAQERILRKILPSLAATTVWGEAGAEAGMAYKDFQAKLPLVTHEDLAPAIARMIGGEADVLWPGTCQIYCQTSGASTGEPRMIPVTEAMLRHFKQCGLDSLLWYSARVGHTGVFRGRHLSLTGSTAMAPVGTGGFEAYAGGLSGITALNLPKWVEQHFSEPGPEVAQIEDWPAKIAAITSRTSHLDITLLSGSPPWVLGLATALRDASVRGKARAQHLQGIWPNFECFVHGGVSVAPYQDELRGLLGPTVTFHEVLPSAEAFLAAQDGDAADGLRLMADAGVFYEFLPMSEYDPARLSGLGTRTVPISGVTTGADYAVVLTTPAGLVRYVSGDVVRFQSVRPSRIMPVGVARLQLDSFGERVNEQDLGEALVAICKRNGWTIVNFHVAPIFGGSTTSRAKGRHEWWVELKPGTITTPTGPIMAVELDQVLRRRSQGYAAARSSGALDAPYVRLVMPGVFEHWMRHHRRWGGEFKVPRCRNDRVIADELADALQFAKD
jgi:hypothetical protein